MALVLAIVFTVAFHQKIKKLNSSFKSLEKWMISIYLLVFVVQIAIFITDYFNRDNFFV
jgi:hypothetical protein